MTAIYGFSDAESFILKDNIPYYHIQGDSYLAKFKNGLCLDDVIDFNEFCEYFGKKLNIEAPAVSGLKTPGPVAALAYTMESTAPTVEYATKHKITREKGRVRIPKKLMQKYKNKMRDEKTQLREEMGGEYCSFMDAEMELKTYQESYEIRQQYKKVVASIAEKYEYFQWKRKLRSHSTITPRQYFERNEILYYYTVSNGNLLITEAFVKLPGVYYVAPLHMYTDAITRRVYTHTTHTMLVSIGYYDTNTDEYYQEDMEDYEDMSEYYADF